MFRLIVAAAAISVTTPAQQTQPPAPVLRTAARLVQFNVVATDSKGRPVEDLTREDLILTEDGKPQTLRVFSLERGDKTYAAAKPLPAGFFSNRLEYKGGVPNSATVILIDLISMPPGFYGRAGPQISAFLHRSDPRFRTAVYALSRSGLRVLIDFTTDPALLRKPLPEVRDTVPKDISQEAAAFLAGKGDAAKWSTVITGGGDALDLAAYVIAHAEAIDAGVRAGQDTRWTFQALKAIARRLSAVPGRKNLVWITTAAVSAFSNDLEPALRALNDASVAVYPIDPRGLLALSDAIIWPNSMAPPRRGNRGRVQFEPSATPSRTIMEQVASRTGGKLFFGQEVAQALPEVFEHASVSYTLAYYPTNSTYDGRFRRINVRTTRPGVRLSYRTGYYAVPDTGATEEQTKTELLGAIWSPMDATAVQLDATLEHVSGAPADERILETRVGGGALAFEPHPKGLAFRLTFYVVQKNAEGRQVDGLYDNIEIVATEQQARALQERGYTHRKTLRLKPETAILRAVVRNSLTGALGTLSISTQ